MGRAAAAGAVGRGPCGCDRRRGARRDGREGRVLWDAKPCARGRGGWPTAWDISVWARLERGDKVAEWVRALVRNSLAINLHNSGANQSDASFGYTAGVAESLAQSHAGEISLLPALPSGWSEGTVSGLRARGGFEVSILWKSGKLQSAALRNANATACKVRYGAKTAEFSLKAGQSIRLNAELLSAN